MTHLQYDYIYKFYSEYHNDIIDEYFHPNTDYTIEHISKNDYLQQLKIAIKIVEEFYNRNITENGKRPTEEECENGIEFLIQEFNQSQLSYIIIGKFLDEFIMSYRRYNCLSKSFPKYEEKYKAKLKDKREQQKQEEWAKKVKEVGEQRKKSNYDMMIHMRNRADREEKEKKQKEDDDYFKKY